MPKYCFVVEVEAPTHSDATTVLDDAVGEAQIRDNDYGFDYNIDWHEFDENKPRTDVIDWAWEEAFDKFGFGDGDGLVMTWDVAAALEHAGYTVECDEWGMHNTVIVSIKKDDKELISKSADLAYDDPRQNLPADIVQLLDNQFPKEK